MDKKVRSHFDLQRARNKEKVAEGADRISELPDVVLHHILSFLSTTEVLKTAFLGRRWRYLWTHIPTIHFDEEKFSTLESNGKFVNFVDNILNSYNAISMQKFYLLSSSFISMQSIERWFSFAADWNVKEINVQVSNRGPYTIKLPRCESVRVLSLEFQLQDVEFCSGTFSSLEFLSLERVLLDDNIGDVISKACPRLKTLHLLRCQGINSLRIGGLVLEDLKIERCVGLDTLSISGYQLQSLCVQDSFDYRSGSSCVDISAPNLQTFKWLDFVVSCFSMKNAPSLNHAHICLLFDFYPVAIVDYLQKATKLLCNLLCASCLTIEMVCFWDVSTQKNLLERLPVTLRNNIKQLIVWLDCDDAYVFGGISCLLESCPRLESLLVNIVDHQTHRAITNEFPDMPVSDKHWRYPNSSLDHLADVKIREFKGKEYEIEFVKFLLEYARALKGLIIILSREISDVESTKSQIFQKVRALKTASSDVKISCF
uniref:F-box/LRR-repeat protein 13 n=1 Tax=Anthurium amnicola TaxID=1678845 RepID=A0A1D1XL97_9ARAE